MDYIREELLRQQAALTRLLLGSGREREDEEWENDPTREEVLSEEEKVFLNSRKLAALETARTGRHLVAAEESSFWRELPEETAEAAVRRETEREWAGELPARSGGASSAYRRRYGMEPGETAGEALVSVVTEGMSASAAEAVRARELSRVFQRDARRYDGGFTLF